MEKEEVFVVPGFGSMVTLNPLLNAVLDIIQP
jgi:hypothetical protein